MKTILLSLLFTVTALAQINTQEPIPGYGSDSVRVTVATPTITCTFSVYNKPTVFRACSFNGRQMVDDNFSYHATNSFGYYNFNGVVNYIYFYTDIDSGGKWTFEVQSSSGSAGPNQFPGQ